MRLRTKLSLAFTLLALLPTGILGWAALSTVKTGFERVFTLRLSEAERTLNVEVARTGEEIARTVDALSTTSPAVEQVARDLYLDRADPAALVPLGERLMVGRDLGVLYLLDESGRVLSSGHLPARFGYAEPDLLALAKTKDAKPVLRWVEVRRGDRIDRALALLSARPVPFGRGAPKLFVVGGRIIGDAFVSRLADLTGASVRLATPAGETLAGGEATKTPRAFGLSLGLGRAARTRTLPLDGPDGQPLAVLEASVSDAPLARARTRILVVLLAAGLLGLVAAVLLGGLLASRITRPVDALAAAAGRIGAGDYETRVETQASGELAGLVGAFNTMTEEIRGSRDRIASAERVAAWQEIARRLAHEIKNPLTPISTSIETLRRTWSRKHPEFDEIFQESTQAILEEVEALERIVDAFSRFARLPAPQPEPAQPGEIVDATLALFPEPPAGITLEREIAADLPKVLVDKEQLQQVLLNLVTNAVQAIQGASGTGRVVVRAAAGEGETVLLEVSDDGPGIPEENLADLFTPYFTTKETGTGLGLAICHRIVAEHGGRIEVASEPGAGMGARFSVVLPVAPA